MVELLESKFNTMLERAETKYMTTLDALSHSHETEKASIVALKDMERFKAVEDAVNKRQMELLAMDSPLITETVRNMIGESDLKNRRHFNELKRIHKERTEVQEKT